MDIRLRDRIACAKYVFDALSEISGTSFEHSENGAIFKVMFRGSGDAYMISIQVTALHQRVL